MRFCGLDVGTTGVKALVFDEKGAPVSAAYRAYSIKVESNGTRLLKARELWDKTREAFAEAVTLAGGKADAVSAASFGEAFIALDKNGGIISDPMLFTDRWGEREYFEAGKKTSTAEIARVCGLPLSPAYSLSKILYLKEEHPEIYEKIDKILLIQDFINYMFCGEAVTDYSTACRTMFFDVRACEWSADLIAKFGLDRRHYSRPVPMGSVLGKIPKSLSAELGLKGETAVVAGGHDQPVNAIGAGLEKDSAACSMGTAECITLVTGRMLSEQFIAQRGIPSEPLWEKGKFCCLAYNSTAGLLIQWYNGIAGEGKDLAFLEENIPPEPSGILVQPYLMGSGTPYMDSKARLAITGIDYGATKFDIYRAILEGLVLDQKLNLSVLEEQDVSARCLNAVGGGSKSKAWLKLKADILEIPVNTLKVKEAGALGAAVLCASALGMYSSLEEGAGEMSAVETTLEPDLSRHDFYAEKFERYRELYGHVKKESEFAALSR